MATTTNYGWTTPDDTALVKDGAAAIRTLGSSVDTTTKNLNPETTLGDLAYRSSTANVKTRLALGTANQILRVNSGGNAPEWATVSSGGMTLLSTTTLSGATTDITGIDQTYKTLEIYVYGVTNATADGVFFMTPRNSTTSLDVAGLGSSSTGGSGEIVWSPTVGARLATTGGSLTMDRTNANNFWVIRMANYASTANFKSYEVIGAYFNTNDAVQKGRINQGCVTSNSAVDGLRFSNSAGNLSTGTVLVYGVK